MSGAKPSPLPGLIVHSHRGAEWLSHAQAAVRGAGLKPGAPQPALQLAGAQAMAKRFRDESEASQVRPQSPPLQQPSPARAF